MEKVCFIPTIVLFSNLFGVAQTFKPKFKLLPAEKVKFNSFVDCDMAEAWVGDTFRIFPGKYGEDPVWGLGVENRYADGKTQMRCLKAPLKTSLNP